MKKGELGEVLAATAVGEVWSVGRRISEQLGEGGIRTALDLTLIHLATVKRRFSVVFARTVRELQCTPCMELENNLGEATDRLYAQLWSLRAAVGGLARSHC